MTIAFCLGNGISRQEIDLSRLQEHGPIYGCNALYKEYEPDVLVATDQPISTRIQESGYSARKRFYTRRCIPGRGAHQISKKYYGNSSGPVCASIAAEDGHDTIYLIGYDMGPNSDGKFNNVYAGTEFYKRIGDLPTFTGNWIKQIRGVTTDFPMISWIRVCGPTTQRHPELDGIKNLKHQDIALFLDSINNQKE